MKKSIVFTVLAIVSVSMLLYASNSSTLSFLPPPPDGIVSMFSRSSKPVPNVTNAESFAIQVAPKSFTQVDYQNAVSGEGPCMNTYMGLTTDNRYVVTQALLDVMASSRAAYVLDHSERFVVID